MITFKLRRCVSCLVVGPDATVAIISTVSQCEEDLVIPLMYMFILLNVYLKYFFISSSIIHDCSSDILQTLTSVHWRVAHISPSATDDIDIPLRDAEGSYILVVRHRTLPCRS